MMLKPDVSSNRDDQTCVNSGEQQKAQKQNRFENLSRWINVQAKRFHPEAQASQNFLVFLVWCGFGHFLLLFDTFSASNQVETLPSTELELETES